MAKRIKTNTDRITIYSLLVEGNIQARVSQVTGLPKDKVSKIAKKLVEERYLLVESRGKEIVYTKGPEGPKLDSIRVADSCNINARGVTRVAKNEHLVKTVNVHHILYKFKVLKEGTIAYLLDNIKGKEISRPFLTKKNGPYRGEVYRYYGQVQYFEAFLTVFYESTPKMAYLYIYAPELEVSPEEWTSRKWKEMTTTAVTEVAAFIQEKGGWQLGEAEETDWQKHFAIDDPAKMKGFADHLFMKSRDGKAWASNSHGNNEFESSEEQYIDVELNMPGEVIQLKGKVTEIREVIEELLNAFYGLTKIETLNAQLHTANAKDKAESMIEEIKSKSGEKETGTVQSGYDGVMYQ